MRELLGELTRALCDVRSPVGEEAALAEQLAYRSDAERIGNSVVLGRAAGAKPVLALFGHLDTVPIQEGDFPAYRAGGRVHGRGASDMKGALAVMIALWERLDRPRLPVELVCVFYDREEGPYEQSGLGPLLEARPDLRRTALALCLEPTDLALQVGCCGSLHATLTFRGRSAHSARPWQGKNAVHQAGALLQHLDGLPPREMSFGELTYREVMSVTRIEGFTGRNVVPARCELNLNFRFAPGRSVDEAEAEVRALAERFGAECTVTDRAPAGPVVLDNPLIRKLRALTGAPVEPKQAWTDVARLGLFGIAAANFGPGEQAQAHQKGESCSEEALERGYLLLQRFLTEAA
ncbi:MAG TPA: succinyl-diaminopimelate desuccinylase [Myxococcales bacterium]|jgi:succinyl-diaminopimelate desuccinylase|nr:succinyl-diaminopimelate desuccinylase [Myxococcales bacterium]